MTEETKKIVLDESENYARVTSEELFNKIKEFEGLRLKAYLCPGGVWTIGYGHTEGVLKGDRISEQQAEEWLREDIMRFETEVLKLKVCKYQGQLDALVDFAFNCGIKALKESTLLRHIKSKMPREVVAREFRKWCYAGKKRVKGLMTRRMWEISRFYDNECTIEEIKEMLNKKEEKDDE